MSNQSFEIAKSFLGKTVEVTIDRPLGSKHPRHGFVYEVNYGYVDGVKAPDGDDLDAYYLGSTVPLQKASGKCIAIVHRKNDDDDKLIVVDDGTEMNAEEIRNQIHFQEQWFDSTIIMHQ